MYRVGSGSGNLGELAAPVRAQIGTAYLKDENSYVRSEAVHVEMRARKIDFLLRHGTVVSEVGPRTKQFKREFPVPKSEILVFSLPYTRESLLWEREHVSRPGGGGCPSSCPDAAPSLPSFLFFFRCFLFGWATSVFSERFFNRMRPKKKTHVFCCPEKRMQHGQVVSLHRTGLFFVGRSCRFPFYIFPK